MNLSDKRRQGIEEMLEAGEKTHKEIAKAAGVCVTTVYHVAEELKEKKQKEATVKRQQGKNFRTSNLNDRYYISRY